MHCPQHHIPVHCLPQCRVRKAFKLNAKKKDSGGWLKPGSHASETASSTTMRPHFSFIASACNLCFQILEQQHKLWTPP